MKWKIDRIISVATLMTSLLALFLVLKRPAPVVAPQTPAQAAANAQSFEDKLTVLEQPAPPLGRESVPTPLAVPQEPEVRITSDEVTAALAQSTGRIPAAQAQLSPGTDLGAMPEILDQQIGFDGDTVHGQFLTKLAGKDVWLTVAGHLGSKDGFATFEPSEFKVGDLNIPVSLVNDALQKRLADQKDHLKLPDNVGGVKVENGQLVLTQK